MASDECTYVYDLKRPERVPVTESLFDSARLVCPGDKGYPFRTSEQMREDTGKLTSNGTLPQAEIVKDK